MLDTFNFWLAVPVSVLVQKFQHSADPATNERQAEQAG